MVAVVRRWLPSLARSVIAPLAAGGAVDPGAAQSRRGRIDWCTVVDIIAAAVLYGVTTGIFISLSERLAVPYCRCPRRGDPRGIDHRGSAGDRGGRSELLDVVGCAAMVVAPSDGLTLRAEAH